MVYGKSREKTSETSLHAHWNNYTRCVHLAVLASESARTTFEHSEILDLRLARTDSRASQSQHDAEHVRAVVVARARTVHNRPISRTKRSNDQNGQKAAANSQNSVSAFERYPPYLARSCLQLAPCSRRRVVHIAPSADSRDYRDYRPSSVYSLVFSAPQTSPPPKT